ncbi:hypothetical protein EPO44_03270 [bacterium]|nr:MAG: hypothetical protein EPO44_03270 [bacterium]
MTKILGAIVAYPVPQNAPHVNAGMDPERVRLARKRGSFGMNVLSLPEGKRPKATDVSPWYGAYPCLTSNVTHRRAAGILPRTGGKEKRELV